PRERATRTYTGLPASRRMDAPARVGVCNSTCSSQVPKRTRPGIAEAAQGRAGSAMAGVSGADKFVWHRVGDQKRTTARVERARGDISMSTLKLKSVTTIAAACALSLVSATTFAAARAAAPTTTHMSAPAKAT